MDYKPNHTLTFPGRKFLPGKLILTLLLISIQLPSLQAQEKVTAWAFAGTEMLGYTGDLNAYAQFNGAFVAGFRLNHKPKFNGQVSILIGKIKGDNSKLDIPAGVEAPNSFFSTSVLEIYYNLSYQLIHTSEWKVYVSQGIGFFRFNPKDEIGNSLINQPDTRMENETYRNSGILLPTKLGVMYHFQNDFALGFEGGWHNPLTDYLDNISEMGTKGNDNILGFRLSLYVPVSFSQD